MPPRALAPLPQVHVEPGHRHGSKVVFRGEAGSDSPDVLPGDLIFILEQARGRLLLARLLDRLSSLLLPLALRREAGLGDRAAQAAPLTRTAAHARSSSRCPRPRPRRASAEGARGVQAHRHRPVLREDGGPGGGAHRRALPPAGDARLGLPGLPLPPPLLLPLLPLLLPLIRCSPQLPLAGSLVLVAGAAPSGRRRSRPPLAASRAHQPPPAPPCTLVPLCAAPGRARARGGLHRRHQAGQLGLHQGALLLRGCCGAGGRCCVAAAAAALGSRLLPPPAATCRDRCRRRRCCSTRVRARPPLNHPPTTRSSTHPRCLSGRGDADPGAAL